MLCSVLYDTKDVVWELAEQITFLKVLLEARIVERVYSNVVKEGDFWPERSP